ncbi:MAG: 3-keto-5-aminohexanoate cleavage protein [Hyphomicrobiales bacterium]|nr:3-keto-5-aminohexanoate cleavage protein [Hyphomicrobiales bacterium]
MEPLIITAACGQAKPPRAAATPDSVEEVIAAVVEAAQAGAAVAQIRAPSKPDPVTGRPRADLERWKAMVSGIRNACDILIHTGTAAMEVDHRIAMIETVRPDLASFLLGHHGIVVRGHEHASLRTRADSLRMAKGHLAAGIKPDFEVFHSGHVRNLEFLLGEVALPKPLAVTLFFGWDGGEWSPPTVEELLHRVRMLPAGVVWSITTAGAEQTIMHALAIARGGHVRAGLGDYPYYNEGVPAKNSREFVARIARLAEELNRPVATAEEAARILGLSRS